MNWVQVMCKLSFCFGHWMCLIAVLVEETLIKNKLLYPPTNMVLSHISTSEQWHLCAKAIHMVPKMSLATSVVQAGAMGGMTLPLAHHLMVPFSTGSLTHSFTLGQPWCFPFSSLYDWITTCRKNIRAMCPLGPLSLIHVLSCDTEVVVLFYRSYNWGVYWTCVSMLSAYYAAPSMVFSLLQLEWSCVWLHGSPHWRTASTTCIADDVISRHNTHTMPRPSPPNYATVTNVDNVGVTRLEPFSVFPCHM